LSARADTHYAVCFAVNSSSEGGTIPNEYFGVFASKHWLIHVTYPLFRI